MCEIKLHHTYQPASNLWLCPEEVEQRAQKKVLPTLIMCVAGLRFTQTAIISCSSNPYALVKRIQLQKKSG